MAKILFSKRTGEEWPTPGRLTVQSGCWRWNLLGIFSQSALPSPPGPLNLDQFSAPASKELRARNPIANSFKLKLGILAENHEMLLRQKIQGLLPFETDRLHFGLGLFLGHFVQGFNHDRGVFFPVLNQNEPPVLIE